VKKILCTLLLLLCMVNTALAADFANLVILHSNDTHGYDQRDAAAGINGMAAIAALRQELLAQGKDVLLLDAGDAIQDNNLVNLSRGATAMQFMNAVGYDAMCLGNHEFDYGQDELLARRSEADFPMLNCNIVVEATGQTFMQPTALFQKGENRIGVVGITTPEAMTSTSPDHVRGLKFLTGQDLYRAVQTQVNILKAHGAELIIAVGHMGSENFNAGNRSDDILDNVNGIDIFIDGHDHQVKNEYIGSTLLAETGSYTKNIGHIVYRDGKWVEELIPFSETNSESQNVKEIVDKAAAEVDRQLNVTIGTSAFELSAQRAPGVRTQETGIGDLFADALLWQARQAAVLDGTRVDGAIQNGGGIRAALPAGNITKAHIAKASPYNNMLYITGMKGRDLLEIIEASTCSLPDAPINAFPQVAGISFTLDTRTPYENGRQYPASTYCAPKQLGSRVTIHEVGGKPFDPDAEYNIATLEFATRGGDSYGHLVEPGVAEFISTGYVDKDAICNFIKEELNGVISERYAAPAGRITIVK